MEALEREIQIATDWFEKDNMIVNAEKFEAIIVRRNSDRNNQYTLDIDSNSVTSEKCVQLIGIDFDKKFALPHYESKQSTYHNKQATQIFEV